ncbi:zinc finger protein rotund-like isoform X2 [Centruroides vittatus]|uniref:zinc finger protein rotund-like isoform X2 n=1 Tax=Centruroides sculpturatus TaxID=218467 RepID=UPI000C6E1469|nr:zinc finger protein rotund-like isoform X2 [Centruroides sculpturatus]
MTLHVGKDCPVSLMQSCVELHQTPVQFRRNLQESSETPVSTNCTTCDPYGFFPSKQSFSRLRSFGGSPNMYSKPALVWSPAPDPHGKSSGNTSSTRPGSPSSGLVHWMSMMADHNHDVHYMWNGVETKMNTSDQHATPPLQKGPVSGLDDNRASSIEPSQIHGIYGNHGNRTSSSGSPPVSTPSSSGSMVVIPQPINAIAKGPALGSASTNGTGRKYQCKMCPQIFMHKSAMQHHAREVHRGDLKPHQCQQCLKSFSSNHQLTQHIRIHTGEKPYKCSYCDRRFKQLSHVQQHTRLHTGERPYKCHLPDCGRAFIQLSNLQQHLRNHDSQMERAKNRPFHCNICGKGFASESSLRTHRSKQHAALIGGANSQSCPVCHKICLNGEALMEHMRSTHKDPNASGTPNKRRTTNHPCPVCGKTYVNEGSLRKHITSHPEAASVTSSLRMWPCTVCQSVFTHETGLLHHMEHMRMDPKHQFAAQYVLSRAAAERREKEATCTIPATPSGSGIVMSRSNGNMETGRTALDSHSICPGHPLVLTSQQHPQ